MAINGPFNLWACQMLLAIASICLICAAGCNVGLGLQNRRHAWWPRDRWIEDNGAIANVPARVRQVYGLGNGLVFASFVILALWASHFEKQIGRLPVLTTLCFFSAFIHAAISIILAQRVAPAPVRDMNPIGFEPNESGPADQ